MSICHFDGTHTQAKRGGKKVSYQGRKKSKTTNTLWLTDANGLVVVSSSSSAHPYKGREKNIKLDYYKKWFLWEGYTCSLQPTQCVENFI